MNADDVDILGIQNNLYDKNLYAYCDNNPVMRKDESGEFWITVGIMAVGGAIGAAVSAVSSAVTQKAFTGTVNWKSVGVAAISGFVSGAVAASPLGLGWQVGGPGANQNMALTNAIKTSMKTTGRMAARSCAKYAAKQIASTRSWRNNILSVSAWSSSIRFAMGTGISNGITNSWPDIKNWFSGLFK